MGLVSASTALVWLTPLVAETLVPAALAFCTPTLRSSYWLGFQIGGMPPTNNDQIPDAAPAQADQKTAECLGARAARVTVSETI